MYAHVSREEWLFRGLTITTILALVGMAVIPLAVGDIGYGIIWYVENVMKKKVDGGAAAGVLAGTTVTGMSVGAYIAVEAAKEGAEIGLVTAGIIGAAVGAVAGFL
jgi:small-conductance mechanosensitive channel